MYILSTAVFLRHKCQLDFVSDKIINNSDHFGIKCLSYFKTSAILCVLYFLFLHFFIWSGKICQQMWKQFSFYCYIWPRGMIVLYPWAQLAVLHTYNCLLIMIYYRLGQKLLIINKYAVRSWYSLWSKKLVKD